MTCFTPQAFEHPQAVVDDGDLTINEKRAILAAWASDACAVEASPALRAVPVAARRVAVDDILQALRQLDKQADALADGARRATRPRRAGAARRRLHPDH
jgi:hypothetical protein